MRLGGFDEFVDVGRSPEENVTSKVMRTILLDANKEAVWTCYLTRKHCHSQKLPKHQCILEKTMWLAVVEQFFHNSSPWGASCFLIWKIRETCQIDGCRFQKKEHRACMHKHGTSTTNDEALYNSPCRLLLLLLLCMYRAEKECRRLSLYTMMNNAETCAVQARTLLRIAFFDISSSQQERASEWGRLGSRLKCIFIPYIGKV